jgi:hypothetical protein
MSHKSSFMELTIQITLLGQSNLTHSTGPLLRAPNAITIMLTNFYTLWFNSTYEYSILAAADGVRDREGSH